MKFKHFLNHFFYPFYLLQQENYQIKRYLKLLKTKNFWLKFWSKKNLRQDIVWTLKAKFLLALYILLCLSSLYLVSLILLRFLSFENFSFINLSLILFLVFIYLVFNLVLQPFFWLFLIFILYPIDRIFKKNLIRKAQKKLQNWKNNNELQESNLPLGKTKIVIGIVGSYGKTTMKEILQSVLSQKYKVLSTIANYNTPLGISKLILEKLSKDQQILILEMGEYQKGDIRELCQLFTPDIAVITGINEAHQERMGSLQNAIDCIFEIADFASILILNGDDQRIQENYQKFLSDKEYYFYSKNSNLKFLTNQNQTKDSSLSILQPILNRVTFDKENLNWKFDLYFQGQNSSKTLANCRLNLLGEYALGNAVAAFILGQILGLHFLQIQEGLAKLKPVKHRLEPIFNPQTQVLVIDDSYNGNLEGVKEAIQVLARLCQND